jgi:hypothetical protein
VVTCSKRGPEQVLESSTPSKRAGTLMRALHTDEPVSENARAQLQEQQEFLHRRDASSEQQSAERQHMKTDACVPCDSAMDKTCTGPTGLQPPSSAGSAAGGGQGRPEQAAAAEQRPAPQPSRVAVVPTLDRASASEALGRRADGAGVLENCKTADQLWQEIHSSHAAAGASPDRDPSGDGYGCRAVERENKSCFASEHSRNKCRDMEVLQGPGTPGQQQERRLGSPPSSPEQIGIRSGSESATRKRQQSRHNIIKKVAEIVHSSSRSALVWARLPARHCSLHQIERTWVHRCCNVLQPWPYWTSSIWSTRSFAEFDVVQLLLYTLESPLAGIARIAR